MEAAIAEARRRCIVSGASHEPGGLIRFVIGPDGTVVPDIDGRLPGRGLWVTAERPILLKAVAKGAFARAAGGPATTPADLVVRVEALLLARCQSLIGLAVRAGQAVAGYEKTRAMVVGGRAAAVLTAADAATDGRSKGERLAAQVPHVTGLSTDELSLPFGRENVVHAALSSGGLARRFLADAARLAGVRESDGGSPRPEDHPIRRNERPRIDD